MAKWQIVEREGVTSNWTVPRTPETIDQFDQEEDAVIAAKKYVSSVNVDNALAAAEKETSAEMFLKDAQGIYLGDLDGAPWYIRYKKDEVNRKTGEVIHKQDEIVTDENYYELDKKGEIAVRQVPGT